MPNVILGVTGSIAAYRACDLARELMRQGCTVRTCITVNGLKFVTASLFEGLTGQPCLVDSFEEPLRGKMAHIDWAREADVMLVAPATANILNKLAHGVADDMLTTLALAFTGPIVVAPAMNPSMYASDATRESIATLAGRAVEIVEPTGGVVACGESGQGKLASIEEIVARVMAVANRSKVLAGKKVLVTSGPTQEPLDGARFLSNRSSGKMGAALARAALLMGAEVSVVSGPAPAPMPVMANVVRVRTALEMLAAAEPLAREADLVLGAAAVADYRPAEVVKGKIRRSDKPAELKLVPNPDVIAELAKAAKPGARVVAFAAEPDEGLDEARAKMARKGVSAIAVNDVGRSDVGFETDENELTLVTADGRQASSGKQSKLACALWLLDQLFGSTD